ncbi:prepilin peptidase [Algiphilus sp.]|uniref:prepilin peptidase n=1 Tax=Algiphilus sp. TaxID=1872431 RepID=UPI003C331259
MTLLALLFTLLVAAAIVDARQRRVPNAVPLCILALAMMALLIDPHLGVSPGWGASLAGMGLGLLLTMPGYMLGVMGGGDVKLMAAAAFACGWPLALPLVAATAIAMGLLAAVALARGRRDRQPAAPAMALGGLAVVMVAGWHY